MWLALQMSLTKKSLENGAFLLRKVAVTMLGMSDTGENVLKLRHITQIYIHL